MADVPVSEALDLVDQAYKEGHADGFDEGYELGLADGEARGHELSAWELLGFFLAAVVLGAAGVLMWAWLEVL